MKNQVAKLLIGNNEDQYFESIVQRILDGSETFENLRDEIVDCVFWADNFEFRLKIWSMIKKIFNYDPREDAQINEHVFVLSGKGWEIYQKCTHCDCRRPLSETELESIGYSRKMTATEAERHCESLQRLVDADDFVFGEANELLRREHEEEHGPSNVTQLVAQKRESRKAV